MRYFYQMGILPPLKCSYVVKQQPKINFLNYSSVVAVTCIIVLVQRNIFKTEQIPERGTKIFVTSFVCNEPRCSILSCPYILTVVAGPVSLLYTANI